MDPDGGRVYQDSESVLVIYLYNSVYDAFVDGSEKSFMIRENLSLSYVAQVWMEKDEVGGKACK